MNNLFEKIGYLKGIAKSNSTEDAKKLLNGILDLLSDLIDRVDTLDSALEDLNGYVESIDDGLCALEEDVDALDSDDFSFDKSLFDTGFEDDEDDAIPVEGFPTVAQFEPPKLYRCPSCQKLFFWRKGEAGNVICPECGNNVSPEEVIVPFA